MASIATRLNQANRAAFEAVMVSVWRHRDCARHMKTLAELADNLAISYVAHNIPAYRELARLSRDCRFLLQIFKLLCDIGGGT